MPRGRSSSSSRSSGGGGGGGMFGGGAPKRAPAPAPAHHAPSPAPVHHAPPPAMAAPPAMAPASGGLGRTIMEGMAFGTGSAIAHRAVGAVAGAMFGGSDDKEKVADAAAPAAAAAPVGGAGAGKDNDCAPFQRDFIRCVQENKDSIAFCQSYMDSFNQCQRDMKMA